MLGGTPPVSETAQIVSQAAASVKSAAGAVRSVAQSLLKAISPELKERSEEGLAGSGPAAEEKTAKRSPPRDLEEIKVL